MNEIQARFDYAEVVPDIADKLHKHEMTIKGIQSKAIFEIGAELQAAHDELANFRNGIFYQWCEGIGISSASAQRMMQYHEFICTNCTNKELLESLPKSLMYEVTKKSAPPELTQKVLDGEITTHKQWQEEKKAMQKRLVEAEEQVEQAKNEVFTATNDKRRAELRAEQVEKSNEMLRNQCDAQAREILELKDKPTVVEISAAPRLEAELKIEKDKRMEAEQQIAWLKNNPVEPKDYRANKRRIEELESEVATYKAHEEGMTLRQKSEIDEKYSQYRSNFSEISDRAMKVMDLITIMGEFPQNLEIADFAECYIRRAAGAEARATADIEKLIVDLQVLHDGLENYVNKSRRLQVVK